MTQFLTKIAKTISVVFLKGKIWKKHIFAIFDLLEFKAGM